MRGALRQSGIDAARIDYVNTHGTSSPLGDKVEIAAIDRVFGGRFPDVWLNATKGLGVLDFDGGRRFMEEVNSAAAAAAVECEQR